MHFILAALIAVAATACGTPAPAEPAAKGREGWPRELTFAIGVNPESVDPVMRGQPLVDRIEKATGLPVRFFKGTSYSSVVEGMRAKRVDAMETGVFSYLLAEKIAGAEAIGVYVGNQ